MPPSLPSQRRRQEEVRLGRVPDHPVNWHWALSTKTLVMASPSLARDGIHSAERKRLPYSCSNPTATYRFQNPCSWEINPGTAMLCAPTLPLLAAGPWPLCTPRSRDPQDGRARSRAAFPRTACEPKDEPHRLHPDFSGLALQMQKHPLHPYGSFSLPAPQRASCLEPGDEPACPSHGKRLWEPGACSASAAFPSARAGGLHSIKVSLQGSRFHCLTLSCQLI